MKRRAIPFVLLLIVFSGAMARSYQRIPNGVRSKVGDITVEIEFYAPATVRVNKYPSDVRPEKTSLSVIKHQETVSCKLKQQKDDLYVIGEKFSVCLNLKTGDVKFVDSKGARLFSEKTNSASFIPVDDAGDNTYKVKQVFTLDAGEVIYGLGQHQEGKMNQRNQEVFLRQQNTRICIPLIHSIKGYAMFWDNYSPTVFADNAQGMSFESAVGDCIDYYFMYGGNADGVIACIRDLTGQAPMFPLWTYGFWQSRERYTGQEETVGVVEKYRSLGVPLDGIVQDWQYWSTDNNYWNDMKFGNPRFPDPKGMIDKVHSLNAHIMISVWASFGPKSEPFRVFKEKGMLMDFKTYPDNVAARVYDPYNPEARDIYWDYLNRNIFRLGMDAWWLDSTEPDHSDVKEQDFDFHTYLGSFRKVRNAFPLVTVGGVYDHQRQVSSDKRVFILTRSAFTGQQRYGAHSWSGDVYSDWSTLRNQISAGLNFSLTGIPYWNSDIGGFWSYVSYPEGINDPAFHELYVRWMQFGAFTPMMRSHGANTPREIFNFGKRGDWAFDVQEKYINLRYRLLPYIYSASWEVTNRSGSMMRALFMDFAGDKNVAAINNEYMFGRSILVAPVTDSLRTQKIYLPAGTEWVDFWTGDRIKGGCTLSREVPVDILPLYVKSGSILPVGPSVQYATEKPWDDLQIRIYPGAGAEFILYEDENDNYNYEQGKYTTIRMTWNDKKRQLTIHPRRGSYDGMLQCRSFRVVVVNEQHGLGLDNEQFTAKVEYKGKKLTVKLP